MIVTNYDNDEEDQKNECLFKIILWTFGCLMILLSFYNHSRRSSVHASVVAAGTNDPRPLGDKGKGKHAKYRREISQTSLTHITFYASAYQHESIKKLITVRLKNILFSPLQVLVNLSSSSSSSSYILIFFFFFLKKKKLPCTQFLIENGYDCAISQKLLTSPSNKDFIKIFQFLYRKIDPNYVFGEKCEDEFPMLLKTLK